MAIAPLRDEGADASVSTERRCKPQHDWGLAMVRLGGTGVDVWPMVDGQVIEVCDDAGKPMRLVPQIQHDGVHLVEMPGGSGAFSLNGVMVRHVLLSHGDVLRFGDRCVGIFRENGLSDADGNACRVGSMTFSPGSDRIFVRQADLFVRGLKSFCMYGDPGIGRQTLAEADQGVLSF